MPMTEYTVTAFLSLPFSKITKARGPCVLLELNGKRTHNLRPTQATQYTALDSTSKVRKMSILLARFPPWRAREMFRL